MRTRSAARSGPPSDFASFWPYYLREHSRPLTRTVHVLGTLAAVSIAVAALVTGTSGGRSLGAALAAGYGPAWASHFFIEGNRPASFSRPVLSFVADLRMAALALTGALGPHLRAAGV